MIKNGLSGEALTALRASFLPYHRLDAYLNSNSVIDYQGEVYSIKYQNESLTINELSDKAYSLPQIMYVPAERNFLTYIKGAKELKLSSESLQEFNTEYYNAQQDMKGAVQLPINNAVIEYDKLNDTLNLKGENYKVKITDASSGFQSFVPLYLVSSYLADSVKSHSENKDSMSPEERDKFQKGFQKVWNNENLTDEQKRAALSVLSAKFNKTAFINIVEEPEQNLFPSSQWQMLQSLLKLNNMNEDNKLVITTHSPYLINYLTIAIKAKQVIDNLLPDNKNTMIDKLSKIIDTNSCVDTKFVSIYEMEEKTGTIKALSKYNELIPSDNNFLNNLLAETNNLYAELQEIEEENEN